MQRIEFTTLPSTVQEAARIVGTPNPGVSVDPERPFAVVAREQTSPRLVPGGLWATIAWPMSQPLADYPRAILAADLALIEALEPAAGRQVHLAWPGDLLLGPRRVGAVRARVVPPLNATRRPPTLLLTIAVYADVDPADLPRADYPQTSLRAEGAKARDPRALLDALLPRLRDRLVEHEHSGPTRFVIDQLRRRLAFVGQEVRIEVSGSPGDGVVLGLRDDGQLMASVDGRAFAVSSGRVFIPPAPGPVEGPEAGASGTGGAEGGVGGGAGGGVGGGAGGGVGVVIAHAGEPVAPAAHGERAS